MNVFVVIGWWLALSYVGLVAFVLLQPTFHLLRDRGYAVAKVLGLVGFTYILWLAGSLHLLPFGSLTVWLVAIASGLWAGRRVMQRGIKDWPIKLMVAEEAIFAIALAVWAVVRSFNPRIEGVEKLMDAAILNGLLRAPFF